MSIVYHADKGKPLTSQEVDGNFATIAAMSTGHSADKNNPHVVTKAQVGLGAVDNTPDLSKPVSAATQAALALKANLADMELKADAADMADALALKASTSALAAHAGNVGNPHAVTKAQVGLGNCENTAGIDKPVSRAVQTELDLKANLSSPAFTGTPTVPIAARDRKSVV